MASHKHRCNACGTIWEHSDMCGDLSVGEAINRISHMCPRCGQEQYWHYQGPKPASHIGSCERPELAHIMLR
jgi:ribosomal protein L37E